MKRIFFKLILALAVLMVGCGEGETRETVINMTVNIGTPLTLTHPCEGTSEDVVLTFEVGPEGVSLKDGAGFLTTGDAIIRDFCGGPYIFGYVEKIASDFTMVEVMLYTKPKPLPAQEPPTQS